MSKNRFFLFTLLSILSLSACGGVSDSAVKPAEIIRGTTNNETLNGYRSFELGEAILLFMPDKNMDAALLQEVAEKKVKIGGKEL